MLYCSVFCNCGFVLQVFDRCLMCTCIMMRIGQSMIRLILYCNFHNLDILYLCWYSLLILYVDMFCAVLCCVVYCTVLIEGVKGIHSEQSAKTKKKKSLGPTRLSPGGGNHLRSQKNGEFLSSSTSSILFLFNTQKTRVGNP